MNHDDIISYYRSSEKDYKWVWHLSSQLAMHYGFWSDKTKNLREALQEENDVLAKIIGLQKTDYVLDAGCGFGGSALYIAQKYGCKVTGVTLVKEQVKKAQQVANERGLHKRVRFELGDFTNIMYKSNSFDVVWGIESVCHAENKEDFIKEAYRVLKPGGRLMIADGFQFKDNLTSDEQNDMRKWLQGWGVKSLDTIATFEKNLKTFGFKNINNIDVTKNVYKSSRRLYVMSYPAKIVDFVLRKTRLRDEIARQNVEAAKYQYITMQNKLWHYVIVSAKK